MIFISGKAKTDTCDQSDTAAGTPATCTATPMLSFVLSGRAKTDTWYSCYPCVAIFINRKAKTDICNRPNIAVNRSNFVLQLLQIEKQIYGTAASLALRFL